MSCVGCGAHERNVEFAIAFWWSTATEVGYGGNLQVKVWTRDGRRVHSGQLTNHSLNHGEMTG